MTNDITSGSTARKRVLVVDDEPDITELLKLLLEDAGFQVEEARSGHQAIERATRGGGDGFDVVVLDITMPLVDGLEVARRIRASEECKATRIAFHSALNAEWVMSQFSDFDDLLSKPMGAEVLIKRVQRLAETPRV